MRIACLPPEGGLHPAQARLSGAPPTAAEIGLVRSQFPRVLQMLDAHPMGDRHAMLGKPYGATEILGHAELTEATLAELNAAAAQTDPKERAALVGSAMKAAGNLGAGAGAPAVSGIDTALNLLDSFGAAGAKLKAILGPILESPLLAPIMKGAKAAWHAAQIVIGVIKDIARGNVTMPETRKAIFLVCTTVLGSIGEQQSVRSSAAPLLPDLVL